MWWQKVQQDDKQMYRQLPCILNSSLFLRLFSLSSTHCWRLFHLYKWACVADLSVGAGRSWMALLVLRLKPIEINGGSGVTAALCAADGGRTALPPGVAHGTCKWVKSQYQQHLSWNRDHQQERHSMLIADLLLWTYVNNQTTFVWPAFHHLPKYDMIVSVKTRGWWIYTFWGKRVKTKCDTS